MDQYFTTNGMLKQCVRRLIQNPLGTICLEPSAGQGDLVFEGFEYHCVEMDTKLKSTLQKISNVKHLFMQDFLQTQFDRKYKTIIGNPPFSLTLEFIERCLSLLDDNGELIFIVPFNTFQLSSSKNVLQRMSLMGSFTHLAMFEDEHLFKNASVQVSVFRFQNSTPSQRQRSWLSNLRLRKAQSHSVATAFGLEQPSVATHSSRNQIQVCKNYLKDQSFEQHEYKINSILTICKSTTQEQVPLVDIFTPYVGYVCGAEKILSYSEDYPKTETILTILKEENTHEKFYDFVEEATLPEWIKEHKQKLINRKVKTFNENNWFQFGLKRNESIINQNLGKKCIYVYNQTRKHVTNPSFISTVQPFGGNLIMLLPKRVLVDEELHHYNKSLQEECSKHVHSGKLQISYRLLSEMCLQKFEPTQSQSSVSQKMDELVNYLKTCQIQLQQPHNDGRINSSCNEELIIKIIQKQFPFVHKPFERASYDMFFEHHDLIIPINIKITKALSADNSGGFYQLVQAFTNYKFTKEQFNLKRTQLYEILKDKLFKREYNTNLEKDYYYLVIVIDNKYKIQNIIWNQLLCLQRLTYNPNNLPFQINWKLNEKRILYDNILHNMYNFYQLINDHKMKRQQTAIEQLEEVSSLIQ